MPELNQEYSPGGFVAVPAVASCTSCNECAFRGCDYSVCSNIACMPFERDDNSTVIYITQEEYRATQK